MHASALTCRFLTESQEIHDQLSHLYLFILSIYFPFYVHVTDVVTHTVSF